MSAVANASAKKMPVDIWSDIACPWCYTGKRRFEAALKLFPNANRVQIKWRAFELDSRASLSPAEAGLMEYAQVIAHKYGTSIAQAQGFITQMTSAAAQEGLEFRFDRVRRCNMFDAHRVIHWAWEQGGAKLQDAVKERYLRGYMTEGMVMSDREQLVRVAVEVGMDAAQVTAMLTSDQMKKQVLEDEREARMRGIHGVPHFLINGKHELSGAHPPQTFFGLLNEAWQEFEASNAPSENSTAQNSELVTTEEIQGVVCGPDGCSLPTISPQKR